MTRKKVTSPPPLTRTTRYETEERGRQPSYDGPSFGSVFKWVMGVLSVVAGAAILGGFGWMWSMSSSMTQLTAAAASNTDGIKSLTSSIDRLQTSDSNQQAVLATLQVQQTNIQNNASAANITLSGRMERMEANWQSYRDSIDREARWRQNMQPQGRSR